MSGGGTGTPAGTGTLIVEDGSGISGAEAYASVAFKDAYWAARPHSAFSARWAAAGTANKEGASREAAAYLDANWGNFYKGKRRGFVQGLLWPRTDAFDEQNYPLPDLPTCLQAAEAELAARALAAPLAPDTDSATRVKSLEQTVGQVSRVTQYFDPTALAPKTYYSFIDDLLAPILNGSQPNAPNGGWAWS